MYFLSQKYLLSRLCIDVDVLSLVDSLSEVLNDSEILSDNDVLVLADSLSDVLIDPDVLSDMDSHLNLRYLLNLTCYQMMTYSHYLSYLVNQNHLLMYLCYLKCLYLLKHCPRCLLSHLTTRLSYLNRSCF